MISSLKSFVRQHGLLSKVLYALHINRFYYLLSTLLYKQKAIRNIPFKYHLPGGDFIQLYPRGQIALPLFINSYETEEVMLFAAFLKPGMFFVDVGANIGLYTIIADKKLGEHGKIWAFEPSTENYKNLLKNISLNHCKIVNLVNLGLGNKDNQKLTLRLDAGQGDAERYFLHDNKPPPEKVSNIAKQVEGEEILLTTIDSFMNRNNNTKVDFIKMDAEGYEYYVLQGAKTILALNPDAVIMLECTELGAKRGGYAQQDVYDLLSELNLNLFYWDTKRKIWGEDKSKLLNAGNIWACRSHLQLPCL